MIDERFMRLAIEKAKQGIRNGQEPFGACVVKAGKVISCAHNTILKTLDVTAHAEINAIREACQALNSLDLSGCVVYATHEPCDMCRNVCERVNIAKIVYGGSNGIGRSTECSIAQMEIVSDFLREDTMKLLTLWATWKTKNTESQ
ncbi:MAG: nucleoside deaminase [Candidatus Bathyarchaeota archaeon]|nr:MAG: nucleoside deaminase [Candidatus Bathyarchaeota archaeon]